MEYLNIQLRDRPCENLSDLELLKLIADKSNQPLNAVNAFNEFYFRYSNYVWKVCAHVSGGSLEKEDLAKDLFQSSFLKVHLKAGQYKNDKGIKAWLGTIVKNELSNLFRRKIVIDKVVDINSFDDTIADEQNSESKPSFEKEQLNAALLQLSERDRDILLTYYRCLDPHEPNRHLPDEEIEYLTKKYQITSTNLRKIKARALEKLEKILLSKK